MNVDVLLKGVFYPYNCTVKNIKYVKTIRVYGQLL